MPQGPLLGDYVVLIRRWWRTGAIVVGLVLAATLFFTLTADHLYTARASLLPETAGPETAGLTSLFMNSFAFLPGMNRGPAQPGDIVMSLLKSKTLAGRVVDSLGLVQVWEIAEGSEYASREVAIDRLQKSIRVSQNEETLIRLQVEDREPELVAAIANAFLDELNQANQEFSNSAAARTRRFVEQRLRETEGGLAEAQARLEAFQEEHGALALDAQTKTTVEVVAKLQGEIEGLKAKRDAARFSLSGSSSEIGSLSAQIKALTSRVESLTGSRDSTEESGVLLALADLPGLGTEYARLFLAVETQSKVYAMLAQQFEQAKIEEARNTPTVRVLDRASRPLYRTRPRHKLNLAVGLFLGTALALVIVLVLERLAPDAASEGERWREMVRRSPLLPAA